MLGGVLVYALRVLFFTRDGEVIYWKSIGLAILERVDDSCCRIGVDGICCGLQKSMPNAVAAARGYAAHGRYLLREKGCGIPGKERAGKGV